MKIYYDTEFLENGETIALISIGMVAENGRQLYRVNQDFPLWRMLHHDWLMANVAPSLPVRVAHSSPEGRPVALCWNAEHPDYGAVMPRWAIANEVRDFILATPEPELWAWYGAYDHVALAQLWGRMVDLPNGVPMWTNDLKQEAMRLGNPRMPQQAEGEHNALADARHNRLMGEFLMTERLRQEAEHRA